MTGAVIKAKRFYLLAGMVASLAIGTAGAQELAEKRAEDAQSVLFIGNSFTYGAHSAVQRYRADTVDDLNRDGFGGVPALFKLFTREAGLNYRVSLETSGGKNLEWHWQNKRALVDRRWDHVVLQEFSTLDPDAPGDPAKTIRYADKFAAMFAAKNPKVDVRLTATWSRPDQTYKVGGHWYGKPIYQMALDLRRGYDRAAKANRAIKGVNPVGQAFNCAIQAGFADPNPYDGVAFDQIDLWAYDHYHASSAGYYLEALTVFAEITGKDPTMLGENERAADELGLSPTEAVRLQRVAKASVDGADCSKLAEPRRGERQ